MRLIALRLAVVAFTATGMVLAWAAPARAQLGPGWVATNYTKKIHLDDQDGLQTFNWSPFKSVCTPTSCADYSYDSTTDTETFRLLDSRTNRSEIRLQNEYSIGRRQFEGYVTFFEPLNDESLFQIFGSTSGATLCMMRGYSSSGGKIRVGGGIGDIATNSYGVERRINVIHDQDNYVQFYVDGVFKGQFSESEQVDNYWKYGAYGTVHADTLPAVVQWRAVRTFRDGLPPSGLPTPPGAYEAENAVLNGALFANKQTGYTGTGFVDYVNASRDYIEWTVDTEAVGLYDLKFRYALQGGDRPLQIQVNGQLVDSSLSFPATGAWDTWAYATIPAHLLQAGANTVRATAAGSSGPNIDHLQLSTVATGSRVFGDYNENGVVDAADYVVWQDTTGRVGADLSADGSGPTGLPDNLVDQHDYDHWRANFGQTLASAANLAIPAAVPEPSALMLALVCCATFVYRP